MPILWMVLLIVFNAIPTQAATFWDDELESGDTGYSLSGISAGAMSYDTAIKFSGAASLRYNYPASCYPDASAQSNCGGFTDRSFTATTTLFKRFYMRVSNPFTVSDVYTKVMRTDSQDVGGSYSGWWGLGMFGDKDWFVTDQNVPVGDATNKFSTYDFPLGTWVCIETEETLNTPGVANGIQRAWADGVQIMNFTNITYRASGDTNQLVNNRLYRQTGFGNIWLDRLAVGNTRIGCLGSPPADTTPPAAPSGIFISKKD